MTDWDEARACPGSETNLDVLWVQAARAAHHGGANAVRSAVRNPKHWMVAPRCSNLTHRAMGFAKHFVARLACLWSCIVRTDVQAEV